MAALKAQGVRLGRPPEIEAKTESYVVALREEGLSMAAVAARLNDEDVPTARGGKWHASTGKVVLDRREAGDG